MQYVVERKEVYVQGVEIEASSPEEAVKKVTDGEGEDHPNMFDYSHTLEPDTWNVFEKKL